MKKPDHIKTNSEYITWIQDEFDKFRRESRAEIKKLNDEKTELSSLLWQMKTKSLNLKNYDENFCNRVNTILMKILGEVK